MGAGNTAVLAAPPGAGKTTVVPLALLDQPWLGDGKILVLEPRRLAARAAADRMAATLGQQAGRTVGYRTRLQSRIGATTRIEVVTEGVFTRMILDDPGLEGVGAVLFDEFHERSLDADLGLALARETQGLLRDDLRLLVMSATLDVVGVSRLLDGAPVIEAEGRVFPVETRYLGRNPAERFEEAVTRACLTALGEESGSVLVFLPGQGEIHRVARLVRERLRLADVDVTPLYGGLDRAEQDRAIEPAVPGRRKLVLATSVAETSLTIEGVRVVIDGGLSRVPRFEPSSGLTRLATVKVSRSSAEQRRGRAGRTAPGVCYRLWDEEQTRGLVAHQRPEIQEADLTGLALDLARWGARSVEGLALLDPPPAGAMAEARKVLTRLGALQADGGLSAHGMRLTKIPLSPRLAHMVAVASDRGDALAGARIAAVLSEPGLGGSGVDLSDRLVGLTRDQSPRARDALKLADRWARAAGGGSGEMVHPGLLLAEAFPERIAAGAGQIRRVPAGQRTRRHAGGVGSSGARALAGGRRTGWRRCARPGAAGGGVGFGGGGNRAGASDHNRGPDGARTVRSGGDPAVATDRRHRAGREGGGARRTRRCWPPPCAPRWRPRGWARCVGASRRRASGRGWPFCTTRTPAGRMYRTPPCWRRAKTGYGRCWRGRRLWTPSATRDWRRRYVD